jgi:hypothetical protein
VPGDVHDRELRALLAQQEPPLVDLRGLDRGHRGRGRSARDRPEILPHPRQHVRGLHVAHHDQDRVVGPVVGVVEGAQLGGVDALDVGRPADGGPVIRARLEGQRAHRLVHRAVRIVLTPHAALFQDHLALGVDLRGIQQQVPHPIGLDLQNQVQTIGRDVGVVAGHVLGGERILSPAALLDEPGDLAAPASGCALEHEVLEKVGETRRARPLVAGADTIQDLHGHDRVARILLHEQAEPVVERGLDDLELYRRRRRAGRLGESGCADAEGEDESQQPGDANHGDMVASRRAGGAPARS